MFFEPGENHWHGAAPNRLMVHVAVQEYDGSGSAGVFTDPVTDEQYNGTVSNEL